MKIKSFFITLSVLLLLASCSSNKQFSQGSVLTKRKHLPGFHWNIKRNIPKVWQVNETAAQPERGNFKPMKSLRFASQNEAYLMERAVVNRAASPTDAVKVTSKGARFAEPVPADKFLSSNCEQFKKSSVFISGKSKSDDAAEKERFLAWSAVIAGGLTLLFLWVVPILGLLTAGYAVYMGLRMKRIANSESNSMLGKLGFYLGATSAFFALAVTGIAILYLFLFLLSAITSGI